MVIGNSYDKLIGSLMKKSLVVSFQGNHQRQTKSDQDLFYTFHGFSNPCAVNNSSFSRISIVAPDNDN